MDASRIQRIAVNRLVHQLVAQRLVERVFNQPLISNVERGAYIECLVELALSDLRPAWSLTDTWDAWDLQQEHSGARIEVKQSAAAQLWTGQASQSRSATASFDIAPRTGYYVGSEWLAVDRPQRFADLYIFAHHDVADPNEADHRDPDQWSFYVVPERRLPDQKTISLNPLAKLASALSLGELADAVEQALDGLPLKASELQT